MLKKSRKQDNKVNESQLLTGYTLKEYGAQAGIRTQV